MSIPKLGLTEKQLSFLAFFKDAKQEIYSPRAEVLNRQKQQLPQCVKLIEQLNQAWDALKKESEDFKTQFPSFTEDKLSQIVLHINNWNNTKHTLDQTVAECSKVYVPADITSGTNQLSTKKKNIDTYLTSANQYLELCAIEREITSEYNATKRNYQRIASIVERYQKLPLEIQNFIKFEPRRLMTELKEKLDILNRFNQSMRDLGTSYAQLSAPVRTGKLVFKYAALATVKKDLAPVPDWLSNFKKLYNWVETLKDDNKNMLVGANPLAETNLRGEYQNYAASAEKMQAQLDESRNFYKGAEVCAMIETLSKNTLRKKSDVTKVMNQYRGLSAAASVYVDAKLVALLNSMSDSSDMLAQLEEMITTLEASYHKLPADVKSGSPAYSYDKFAVVQTSLQKALDWCDSHAGMNATLKALGNKVELQTALRQKINTLDANAVKVKAAANELPKIEKAHDFESDMIKDHVSLNSEESVILGYQKRMNTLSAEIKSYVSPKWKDILTNASSYHNEKKQLRTRMDTLLKEFVQVNAAVKDACFDNYFLYEEADKKSKTLHTKYMTLLSDINAFRTKYSQNNELSTADLKKYDDYFIKYSNDYTNMKRGYELYNWAKGYQSSAHGYYNTSELRQKLDEFRTKKSQFAAYDSKRLMETVFESVDHEISRRAKAEAERYRQNRRKERNKRTVLIVFALLSIVAMVVMGVLGVNHMVGGGYWLWLLISAGIGVISVLMVNKAFKSTGLNVTVSVLYAIYFLGVTIPVHFWANGSTKWFLSLFVMGLIVVALIQIFVEESSTIIFYIYDIGLCLFGVFFFGYSMWTAFAERNFLDKTFFGRIGNFFIGLWAIIVGLFKFILQLLAYLIGGGFWMNAVYVAIGEAIVLLTAGSVLYFAMKKRNLDRRLFA